MLQHRPEHDPRTGLGLADPGRNGGEPGVGDQAARLPYPELGDPPVGARKLAQQTPRGVLADGEVLVPGLLAHLPRLDRHREAEPERHEGEDRAALLPDERRHRRVAARDPARRLHRVRPVQHGVGGRDRHLRGAPASHHVAEVDQACQARALERGLDDHVVVVGVVVDDGARQRVEHGVEEGGGAAEGGRDEVAAPIEVPQVGADRHRRGVHAPRELTVERGVVEAGERRVEMGEEGAEGLQHGGRAGALLGQRDAGQPGDGAGQVGGAGEGGGGEWGRGGGGGRAPGAGASRGGRGGGDEARDGSRKVRRREVVQAGRDQVQDGPAGGGAQLENQVAAGPGDAVIVVVFTGKRVDLAVETEGVAGDGGGLHGEVVHGGGWGSGGKVQRREGGFRRRESARRPWFGQGAGGRQVAPRPAARSTATRSMPPGPPRCRTSPGRQLSGYPPCALAHGFPIM